jgi:GT2 family glycosyltransferase/spore maturation protein CgeB
MTQTLAPETVSAPTGFLDHHQDGVFRGWVWVPEDPGTRLTVELLANGEPVSTAPADRLRPDLQRAEIGDGAYGFELPVPPGQRFVPPYKVRVVGTDHVLPARIRPDGHDWTCEPIEPPAAPRPVKPRPKSAPSMVRDVEHGAMRVRLRQDSLPEEGAGMLELSWQDRILARRPVSRIRDEAGALPPHQNVELTLPTHGASVYGEMRCVLRVGAEETEIPMEPDLARRPVAHLRVQSGVVAEGWVAPDPDGAPRTVALRVDDRLVWTGVARRDHKERPGAGFKVTLPDPEQWAEPMSVVLEEAASGTPLIAPLTVTQTERFIGRLDDFLVHDDHIALSGWAQDTARPFDPVEVEIRADDTLLCQLRADLYRGDLKANGIGVGRHAFVAKLPLPEGDLPQNVLAVIAGTGLIIGARKPLRVAEASEATALRAGGAAAPAEAAPSAPPAPVSQATLQTSVVEGKIDEITRRAVTGWARYQAAPYVRVLLDLFLDGAYYQTTETRQFRADVARHFGDDHRYGFHFELPPHLGMSEPVQVAVRPRFGRSQLRDAEGRLQTGPDAVALAPAPQAQPWPLPPAPSRRGKTKAPKVAYVILNLNAGHMLEALFDSWERFNRYPDYELIVVDHGSTDGSLEMCEAWAGRLNVTLLARGKNYSFSASNNYGAARTDAEIVVFLNNDIVLSQDISEALVAPFVDPQVGVVGMKLLDQKPAGSVQTAPIQHLGVHYDDKARPGIISPFETRFAPHLEQVSQDIYEVPTVTGAIMACRRSEFLDLGGFEEGYFYGYEDVDLCLNYTLVQGKKVVSTNRIAAYHVRGYSRAKSDGSYDQRRRDNATLLQTRFGGLLRRATARDRFARPGYWSSQVPVIAFAVTEATMETAAGDYFTALELAEDLQRTGPCQIVFLDKNENWFDLYGIDVLITMRDDYDLRKIINAAPHLIRVGWARNWIARWGERPWAQDYDLVWASSQTSADHLSGVLARDVEVVRIATNPTRFEAGVARPALASDYCFTGSFFGAPREIVYNLDPGALPFDFGLFGHGWEEVPQMAPFSRGPLPYSAMPDVYASTRLVIDDANSATKEWGSVNSRVYDAIAAGALVVTNGRAGAREVFGDLMPTYDSPQELEELLFTYLGDEALRRGRVAALQEALHAGQTYAHRAGQVHAVLAKASAEQLRFAIKIGAPNKAVCPEWGDYHYALGLKRALTRKGHSVRIDCLDAWDGGHCVGDDVVIVLRGLSVYAPKPDQVTLMWNISHPDMISPAEYDSYDHVFIASEQHAAQLARQIETPVTALLQCTDPEVFHDGHPVPEDAAAPGLLFVGNSRNVFRKIVRQSVALGLPLEVYGSRWDQFLDADTLRGEHIPNAELARHYGTAKAVLNDHWDDMREKGFISNRIFDAAAAGAYIITDPVKGLDAVFGDAISVVETPEELAAAAALPDTDPARVAEMRARARAVVTQGHSFDARAEEILQVVASALKSRSAIFVRG